MIKNEQQLKITKKQIGEFENTLKEVEKLPDSKLKQAQLDSIVSTLEELREDVATYDALKKGVLNIIDVKSMFDIHKVLIQGRISAGWTQKDLADKLKLKEQQIQRWEASDYETVSLHTIAEICDILNIGIWFEKIIMMRLSFDNPENIHSERIDQAQREIHNREALFVVN